jgi:hypothetical protein
VVGEEVVTCAWPRYWVSWRPRRRGGLALPVHGPCSLHADGPFYGCMASWGDAVRATLCGLAQAYMYAHSRSVLESSTRILMRGLRTCTAAFRAMQPCSVFST